MSVLSFSFFQCNPEQKRHKVHNLARLGHRSVHPWEISSWKASNVPVTKVTLGHEEWIKAVGTLHQLLFCLTENTLLESGNFDIWHKFFVREDFFFHVSFYLFMHFSVMWQRLNFQWNICIYLFFKSRKNAANKVYWSVLGLQVACWCWAEGILRDRRCK